MKRLLIFDLDGTILNTLEDLQASLNYAMKIEGFQQRTLLEVKEAVGNGIRRLIERSVSEATDEKMLENLYQHFKSYYSRHLYDLSLPYEGITELLQNLQAQGVWLALVTNKDLDAAEVLVQRFFPGIFSEVRGSAPGIERKPSPKSLLEIMEKYHLKTQDAVMIGDSDVDRLTAEAAGIDFVGVLWGYRNSREIDPDGLYPLAANTQQLSDILYHFIRA